MSDDDVYNVTWWTRLKCFFGWHSIYLPGHGQIGVRPTVIARCNRCPRIFWECAP